MESLTSTSKRSEDDANISTFRRRNKIIILVFLFLIISSALIIAALIVEVVRIHGGRSQTHRRVGMTPIKAFCSVSNSPTKCLDALNPVINDRFIVDPDQIFTISLQTAADEIQNIISSSRSGSAEFAFKNCSNSLRHGLGQLGYPLATMRVNPFVLTLSVEQREEITKRIIKAEEDVKSCIDDDLAKIDQPGAGGAATAEKLLQVEVYLNSAHDFLILHARVMRNWGTIWVINFSDRGIIYDNLFAINMCGLQLVFMFGMFCALFRIR